MLVLTRRETEKVVFPNLGIVIEVLSAKGNKARLGIDAPPEIRVTRAEIAESEFEATSKAKSTPNEEQIRADIDAINLAIQLAQNQLRQGLEQHADDALEQAHQCLRDLEARLVGKTRTQPVQSNAIRESGTGYQVGHQVTSRNEDIKQLIQLLAKSI